LKLKYIPEIDDYELDFDIIENNNNINNVNVVDGDDNNDNSNNNVNNMNSNYFNNDNNTDNNNNNNNYNNNNNQNNQNNDNNNNTDTDNTNSTTVIKHVLSDLSDIDIQAINLHNNSNFNTLNTEETNAELLALKNEETLKNCYSFDYAVTLSYELIDKHNNKNNSFSNNYNNNTSNNNNNSNNNITKHHNHNNTNTTTTNNSLLEQRKSVLLELQKNIIIAPPPLCFGWMQKQGRIVPTIIKRFFILEKGFLSYYSKDINLLSIELQKTPQQSPKTQFKTNKKPQPDGFLQVTNYELYTDQKHGKFEIILNPSLDSYDNRKYTLYVDSLTELDMWVKSLVEHINFNIEGCNSNNEDKIIEI
jgi:hypothetical protein